MAADQRTCCLAPLRTRLEVTGSARTHRAAEHREVDLDRRGRGDGRPSRGRWRPPLPVLLERAVGTGRPVALLSNMVWVGVSAGSLVMGPQVGQGFVSGSPVTTGDDRALGLVDFAMFPHLNHEAMPDHSMAAAELWAARLPVPAYAIDDETAIKVVGGTVEVVSEGKWQLFNSRANASDVS